MSDAKRTITNNRFFYSANGFYYNPSKGKWARIRPGLTTIRAFGWNEEEDRWELKLYHYENNDLVMSLNKKSWERKPAEEVPNRILVAFGG